MLRKFISDTLFFLYRSDNLTINFFIKKAWNSLDFSFFLKTIIRHHLTYGSQLVIWLKEAVDSSDASPDEIKIVHNGLKNIHLILLIDTSVLHNHPARAIPWLICSSWSSAYGRHLIHQGHHLKFRWEAWKMRGGWNSMRNCKTASVTLEFGHVGLIWIKSCEYDELRY